MKLTSSSPAAATNAPSKTVKASKTAETTASFVPGDINGINPAWFTSYQGCTQTAANAAACHVALPTPLASADSTSSRFTPGDANGVNPAWYTSYTACTATASNGAGCRVGNSPAAFAPSPSAMIANGSSGSKAALIGGVVGGSLLLVGIAGILTYRFVQKKERAVETKSFADSMKMSAFKTMNEAV